MEEAHNRGTVESLYQIHFTTTFLITYTPILLLFTLYSDFCSVECTCSNFTGIETLINKLAKVRILQSSCNSFFIIQLLINCTKKHAQLKE